MIRADHPNNIKRGGVCVEPLCIKELDVSPINEYLLCDISVQNKRGYVSVLYRSPSQNNEEFDEFKSFENILNNIAKSSSLFTVILGDFNARSNP